MYQNNFDLAAFSLVVLYVLTLGITLSFYNLLRKRSVRIKIRYSFIALQFAP